MALTNTVTLVSVVETLPDGFQITLNLTSMDGAVQAINQNFSVFYHKGAAPSVILADFISQMQKQIDWYNDAKAISNNPALGAALTNIKNALTG